MKKRFLTLGVVALSIAPITIASSCSNNKKDGDNNESNSSSNVVNSITKKKAKFSENQDYFEKTGYDPKRPLRDYNKLRFTDHDYSVNTMSNLVASWGKNKNKKFTLYELKWNEGKKAEYFLIYGKSGYIPYVELYDFAHDKEIKQFGTYKENLDRITKENYQKSLKDPENIAYCKENPEICAIETFESWKRDMERQAESFYRFFYKSEKNI